MDNKKIALITGGVRGIGKSIAINLLNNQYKVILIDNNQENLEDTIQELQPKYNNLLYSSICDVKNAQNVNDVISSVTDLVGIPSILINNAGYGGPFHQIDEVSDNEWEDVIFTNLRGVFNLCRNILPLLKQQFWGRIVNIASIQGLAAAPLSSTYVASKHGVIGYTKAIAAEWGMHGITCNAICPGYVDTAMGAQDKKVKDHYKNIIKRTPVGRLANAEEIAGLVEYLVSDKASFVNGSVINIDGGIMADIGIK